MEGNKKDMVWGKNLFWHNDISPAVAKRVFLCPLHSLTLLTYTYVQEQSTSPGYTLLHLKVFDHLY